MTYIKTMLAGSALTAFAGSVTLAEPALVFDLGEISDGSYNQSIYEGALRWAKETEKSFKMYDETLSEASSASAQRRAKDISGSYKELKIQSDAQRAENLRRVAETGANPIIVTGYILKNAVDMVAPEYPDTKFVFLGEHVEHPNVRTVWFNNQEGSYLVGILAAMASKSGTIGFIGGMDEPGMKMRLFGCAYAIGAKSQNPDIKVIGNMAGTTPAAWTDPVRGARLASAQISQGVDVIFAAAGGTGIGVLQAAADSGILSIGVDANQNHLHPGKVLTSMVKRIDLVVYQALNEGETIEAGEFVIGLADGAVGYALDEYNAALITDEMKEQVDEAAEMIVSGEIQIPGEYSDNTCPVVGF